MLFVINNNAKICPEEGAQTGLVSGLGTGPLSAAPVSEEGGACALAGAVPGRGP